jgi:hypothetical protein
VVASEPDYDSVHSRVPFHQSCTVVTILSLLGRPEHRNSNLNSSSTDSNQARHSNLSIALPVFFQRFRHAHCGVLQPAPFSHLQVFQDLRSLALGP